LANPDVDEPTHHVVGATVDGLVRVDPAVVEEEFAVRGAASLLGHDPAE
jgi:hypothetical protein